MMLRDKLFQAMLKAMTLARSKVPAFRDRKAHQDYVTDIDLSLDRALEEMLSEILPNVPVLSEERAISLVPPVSEYWIVDPIDGTHNLIAGIPFVAISVALVDCHGPRLAAVASLSEQTIWMAMRDQGAWQATHGQHLTPLKLTSENPIELLVLSTGLLDALMQSSDGDTIWSALRGIGKIRNLGAQALHLCGVASGRFAAACSIEARVWDEAAAGLILRQAGGLWYCAADDADWQDPAALMSIKQQRSLACHPTVAMQLATALQDFVNTSKAVEKFDISKKRR